MPAIEARQRLALQELVIWGQGLGKDRRRRFAIEETDSSGLESVSSVANPCWRSYPRPCPLSRILVARGAAALRQGTTQLLLSLLFLFFFHSL